MKVKVQCLALIVALASLAHSAGAQAPSINGTWSGNWTPKGGVPDAVTIELRVDNTGILTGKFFNPVQAEFSKATFSPKTGLIAAEATDQKSWKHYKLEGKIKDTELLGTLSAGDVSGELRLIKWTFFGR
jgi:hypothetical protein